MLEEYFQSASGKRRHYREDQALTDIAAGDIVECVDDTPSRPETRIMPDLGALYTVTSVRAVQDGKSVRLKELTPNCWRGGVCACGDCGWDAGRFRKVYRPDGAFIASLLQDIPEFAQGAPVDVECRNPSFVQDTPG